MRIKHVHITEYKNLRNFSVNFTGDSFIDIFVGKNGSGKSNFFEAFLEILKHIFESDYSISFNYTLKYEIGGQEIQIKYVDVNWVNELGETTQLPNHSLLPENILIYYSGHNTTVKNLVERYERQHSARLNRNRNNSTFGIEDTRKFIGIGSDFKAILLSVLLLQNENIRAKRFILEKLGIRELGSEVKIVLKRPSFANDSSYNFDENDPNTLYWKAQGFVKTFLDYFWNSNKNSNPPVRDEGLVRNSGEEEYIMFRDLGSVKESIDSLTALELFIGFDNLKTIGLLKEVSISMILNSGVSINVNQFSDGQFQSVYIYAITEIFKDKNCITLLDEPDSFLHPEWQYQFLNQVNEISEESAKSNHVLMSSHSAITLISHQNESIGFFDFRPDFSINNYIIPKRIAIEKLSDSLIRYTEQEQILSILNTIQIAKKPVLFTEGKTDPIILKEAWNKLYPTREIPFIPFFAFGHKYLSQIMQEPEVINSMNGLPIFGLFDFDEAFNTWNGFSEENISEDIHLGLVKKLVDHEVYAIMLPISEENSLRNQVISTTNPQGHWGDSSLFTIEHMFCDVEALNENFVEDPSNPAQFKKFQGNKVTFAKTIVPGLNQDNFECFRPLFDFIESKIPIQV